MQLLEFCCAIVRFLLDDFFLHWCLCDLLVSRYGSSCNVRLWDFHLFYYPAGENDVSDHLVNHTTLHDGGIIHVWSTSATG